MAYAENGTRFLLQLYVVNFCFFFFLFYNCAFHFFLSLLSVNSMLIKRRSGTAEGWKFILTVFIFNF